MRTILYNRDLYTESLGDNFYFEKPMIEKPWMHYFEKLYFNMAGREIGMDTVRCALTNIKPERLLFGTDWPLVNIADYAEVVKRAIPEKHWQAVFHDNAVQVFGLD